MGTRDTIDHALKFGAIVVGLVGAIVTLFAQASDKPEHKRLAAYGLMVVLVLVLIGGGLFIFDVGTTWPWGTILDVTFTIIFVGFYLCLLVVIRRQNRRAAASEKQLETAQRALEEAQATAQLRDSCRVFFETETIAEEARAALQATVKRFDLFAVNGRRMVATSRAEILEGAKRGVQFRFLLFAPHGTELETFGQSTGTSLQQISGEREKTIQMLEEIKGLLTPVEASRIKLNFLAGVCPLSSLWISDETLVNIKPYRYDSNSESPVFRFRDKAKVGSYFSEFERMWELATDVVGPSVTSKEASSAMVSPSDLLSVIVRSVGLYETGSGRQLDVEVEWLPSMQVNISNLTLDTGSGRLPPVEAVSPFTTARRVVRGVRFSLRSDVRQGRIVCEANGREFCSDSFQIGPLA